MAVGTTIVRPDRTISVIAVHRGGSAADAGAEDAMAVAPTTKATRVGTVPRRPRPPDDPRMVFSPWSRDNVLRLQENRCSSGVR